MQGRIPVWINLTVSLVREPSGAPRYFISVVEDIHEHKLAGAARQVAEEKFRGIFVNPTDRERFKQLMAARGVVSGLEHEARRKDGSTVWVSLNGRAVRDAAGQVALYEGSIKDITERKQAEAALRELSARILKVQDEERRRLARELHDNTAQTLAAIAMNLSVLRQATGTPEERVEKLLTDCDKLVDRSAKEIRTVSYLLHPPMLEEFGLVRAAREYAEGFAQRSGIRVELDLAEDLGRLPRDAELALFRVLQESLGNVHRHPGSATAAIRLARAADTVTLEVRDAGCGPAGHHHRQAQGAANPGQPDPQRQARLRRCQRDGEERDGAGDARRRPGEDSSQRQRRGRRSLIRSSPRRAWARAPARGWPSRTASSWTNTAVPSRLKRRPAKAPLSSSEFPSTRRPLPPKQGARPPEQETTSLRR